MHLTFKKWITVNSLLTILLVGVVVLSVGTGSQVPDSRSSDILYLVRIPRAILAALVGMALASSGGAFQALLRNPLADPFILGVSGGAALGSVVSIGFHLPFEWVSAAAFLGATVAMLVIFLVSGRKNGLESTRLLLTGVVFNAFCFALILFINAVVTMEEAYQILFLLIGNLEVVSIRTVAIAGVFIVVGFLILCSMSGRMNLLSVGDEEAKSLGIDVAMTRGIIFGAASMVVGAAVATSGLIGFVGLFIPHTIRLLFGADNRLLIPASGLLGAAFLVGADILARTILMNTGYATQLPVGVITALIGAPLFMVLLRKQS